MNQGHAKGNKPTRFVKRRETLRDPAPPTAESHYKPQ